MLKFYPRRIKPGVALKIFIHGICWALWIYGLVSFISFRKFSAMTCSNIASSPSSPLLLGLQLIIHLLDCLTVSHVSFLSCSFLPLCILFWIFSSFPVFEFANLGFWLASLMLNPSDAFLLLDVLLFSSGVILFPRFQFSIEMLHVLIFGPPFSLFSLTD